MIPSRHVARQPAANPLAQPMSTFASLHNKPESVLEDAR